MEQKKFKIANKIMQRVQHDKEEILQDTIEEQVHIKKAVCPVKKVPIDRMRMYLVVCMSLGLFFLLGSTFLYLMYPYNLGLTYLETWKEWALVFFGLQFIAIGVITNLVFYKGWKLIQDNHSRTTPLKAFMLLFVPIGNIKWIYDNFLGYAEDYNVYVQNYELSLKTLTEREFSYLCILIILSALFTFVPPIGIILTIAVDIMLFNIIKEVGLTVNNLIALNRKSK